MGVLSSFGFTSWVDCITFYTLAIRVIRLVILDYTIILLSLIPGVSTDGKEDFNKPVGVSAADSVTFTSRLSICIGLEAISLFC